MVALVAHTEAQRLQNLYAYRILDTPESENYDRIVEMAAELFRVPIVAISLIDETRQWFKAQLGLDQRQTPREWSFCSVAIDQPEPVFVVPQPEQDARFRNNPLVTGAPFIRFYAGARLVDSRGYNLGALCIIDTQERPYPSESERRSLVELARFVSQQMELERTQRELAEKERLLKMAEAMSGVGHWRYEITTGKVSWSPEVYRFFGMTATDAPLTYEQSLKAYPIEHRQRVEIAVAKAIATGEGYSFERQLLGNDGILRTARSSTVCEMNQCGKVEALFGVFQDITAQVEALKAAQIAATAKSEFLANMSHELRTPLTIVVGYSALLRDMQDLSTQGKYYAEQVLSASDALMATINDVLDFSKLEAGQLVLHPEPVSVRTLVEDVARLFKRQAESKRLEIVLSFADSLPHGLQLDPDRLRQILTNLIGNAVKFTEQGHIDVKAEYVFDQLKISVEDTGPGVPQDRMGLLFQRFAQVDGSTTRSNGGTGLGLAICKGLVEGMGGSVGVNSIVGKGSCFWFVLPSFDVALQSQQPVPESTSINLTGYRILLADDNAANRQFVSDVVRQTGATISTVSDGASALKAHKAEAFDLILLDLCMPRMDGYAVAEHFQNHSDGRYKVPLVAFTADLDAVDRLQKMGSQQGFDGVLQKPILPFPLVAKIAEVLGVPRASLGRVA